MRFPVPTFRVCRAFFVVVLILCCPFFSYADSPSSADDSTRDPSIGTESIALPSESSPSETPPADAPTDSDKNGREGWGFAGLPLVNFSSDDGVGYGVKVAAYDYGKNQKPYKTQIALQLFFTTRKVMYHKLFFDSPSFLGTPWRLDLALKFDRVLLSNYYGIGNEAAVYYDGDLGTDSSSLGNDTCDRYFRLENYYTSFQSREPSLILNLRRDLGGPYQLFNGYQLKDTTIAPHNADTILRYTDVEVEDAWTSFLEETKPYGYSGGALAYVQVGTIFDSRDREPSPRHGTFSEVSVRAARYQAKDEAERDGNSPVYAGINLTGRGYINPVGNVVLAGRLVSDLMFGDIPFSELTAIGGSQDYSALGGSTSMRGVRSGRYRGKVKVIATPEIRWEPVEFYAAKQKFNLTFVGFSDIGRVFADYAPDGELWNLHYTLGGGLRIAWNDNFLIRADYGRELAFTPSDGVAVAESITETGAICARPSGSTGIYIVFDHAF